MSEPTPRPESRAHPLLYLLLAVLALVGVFVAGFVIRSIGDDPDPMSVAAVAAETSTPTPTPTPTASPTPSATVTAEEETSPTPTPSPTPTESPSPAPRSQATPEPTRAASPPPPPPEPSPTEEPDVVLTEVPTQAAAATPEPSTTSPPQGDGSAESYAYSAVASLRQSVGAPSLATNSALASVARSWSEKMGASGQLDHNPNAPNQIPQGWSRWGENVAYAPTIEEAMSLLENSSLHYQNMTNPVFTDIGIGVVVDGSGWVWVTQVFAQY